MNDESCESAPDRDLDRPRGVITTVDREYLVGAKNYTGQAERRARYRIRKRVKNSIRDLKLIAEEMEERDLNQTFNKLSDDDIEAAGEFLAALRRYHQVQKELEEAKEELFK